MTDHVMQVDAPAPAPEPELSGTRFPDELARLQKAVNKLTLDKAQLHASNKSLKHIIGNLEVNNDFARFQTEQIHQLYTKSVKARYLSPETGTFTMAHQQVQELLDLLGKERDLTRSLQERLEQETIMSHAIEIGADGLRETRDHALEAVDDLRSQKEQMLTKISHLESLCGERFERIALVERELQKLKSVSLESQGSKDMEIGGVSLTPENGSSKLSSSGQAKPRGHAVCLIDGNHLPFTGDVICTLGGDTTAKRLSEGVRSLLKDDDMDLRVAIYLDTDRVTQAMATSQIPYGSHDFQLFADSFNSVSSWIEMVDTKSPHRVTQMLRLHLEDPKCEFLMFGGEISSHLMSLARGYKGIEPRFYAFSNPEELTRLECQDYLTPNPLGDLFCRHPLEPLTRSHFEPKPSPHSAPSALSGPAARSGPLARSHVENGPSSPHSQVWHESVTFDQLGRRVDPRLYTTQPLINLVTSWRLCNNHYLIGKCVYRGCYHNHSRQLSKDQLDALAFLGRSLVCRNGPSCDDPTCYAGHTCPRQTCDGQQCSFPRDQHLEGTIKTPETVTPYNNTIRSNTTRGRTILPARVRTFNIKKIPPGPAAADWSRARVKDEPLEDRYDLSWR